jgi:hypothetical protein
MQVVRLTLGRGGHKLFGFPLTEDDEAKRFRSKKPDRAHSPIRERPWPFPSDDNPMLRPAAAGRTTPRNPGS